MQRPMTQNPHHIQKFIPNKQKTIIQTSSKDPPKYIEKSRDVWERVLPIEKKYIIWIILGRWPIGFFQKIFSLSQKMLENTKIL